MNSADSMQVAAGLEAMGYLPVLRAEEADVIVLNTCVVRQSAEDKAIGRLTSLKQLKKQNPGVVINLMGCLVGVHGNDTLKQRYPYVDVFSAPSDSQALIEYLTAHTPHPLTQEKDKVNRILEQKVNYRLPASQAGRQVSAFLPIIYGCSHACTYCVIPLRRGPEKSRPMQEILQDARQFVEQGVREITLLGQIVDRYGLDLAERHSLSELLSQVHALEGLERIRFLTSHPLWMSMELLDTIAKLPKVMPHIELPIQSGDDAVLQRMKRGYSVAQFLNLVTEIRKRFEQVSLATDLIVGFPGETEIQFENSIQLLQEIQPDMTHIARFSPRPGTLAAREMVDDVPAEEKENRFRLAEEVQEEISTKINQHYLNTQVPVLFEEKIKSRWRGRTPTNKLVFTESEQDLLGKTCQVQIEWTGPWSMIGKLAE